jgi:hypothetical protein
VSIIVLFVSLLDASGATARMFSARDVGAAKIVMV